MSTIHTPNPARHFLTTEAIFNVVTGASASAVTGLMYKQLGFDWKTIIIGGIALKGFISGGVGLYAFFKHRTITIENEKKPLLAPSSPKEGNTELSSLEKDLQANLNAKTEEAQRLRKQLIDSELKHLELSKNTQDLKSKLEKKNSEVEGPTSTMKQHPAHLSQLQEELMGKTDALAITQKELAKKEEACQTSNMELRATQLLLTTKEEEIANLKVALKDANTKIEEERARTTASKAQASSLQKEINVQVQAKKQLLSTLQIEINQVATVLTNIRENHVKNVKTDRGISLASNSLFSDILIPLNSLIGYFNADVKMTPGTPGTATSNEHDTSVESLHFITDTSLESLEFNPDDSIEFGSPVKKG